MKKSLMTLASLIVVGCGAGEGSPERNGPVGTERPLRGVASGPDGEYTRLGVEDAPNSQEAGVPDGSASACNEAASCIDVCRCAGQSGPVCADLCGGGDGGDGDGDGDGNGNGNGNGNGSGNGDECAQFTDPCVKCACENVDNPTVCIDACS